MVRRNNRKSKLSKLSKEKQSIKCGNKFSALDILSDCSSDCSSDDSFDSDNENMSNNNYDKLDEGKNKSVYVPPHKKGNGWDVIQKTEKHKKTQQKKQINKKNTFDITQVSCDELKNMGDEKILNSKWRVSIHNIHKSDWNLESYDDIYEFDSIGNFWRFFNNFQMLDKINNFVFIMRDGITPIWEDLNNRNGGICSFKIDMYNRGGRNELCSEIMTCISLLVVNESFVSNNECINGLSYSIKNRSIFIKFWIKDFMTNKKFIDKLPLKFLNNVNNILKSCDLSKRNSSNKISIQYKEIIPEYNL
jgi:hypothetical protein